MCWTTKEYCLLSNRVLLLKIAGKLFLVLDLNIIQIYAPPSTAGSGNNDKKGFIKIWSKQKRNADRRTL